MKNQFWPVVLNLIASFFGAGAQWLYKQGAARPLPNLHFIGGMLGFCAVMGFFVLAFKLGGRISVTFPVYALTFVWGTLLGVMVDKEPFGPGQVIGVILVFLGVAMVGALSPR